MDEEVSTTVTLTSVNLSSRSLDMPLTFTSSSDVGLCRHFLESLRQ